MPLVTNGIVIWSGNVNNIPEGWVLCNGSNNTPDLRNRFIIGAGNTYNVNSTGGSAHTIVPTHTHTASGATQGAHTHTFPRGTDTTAFGNRAGNSGTNAGSAPASSTNGAHSHTLSIEETGESGANKNLPPYYALAFIMQTT